MSIKQRYNTDRAVQIMHDLVSDGTDATVYSDKFGVSWAEVWSTHFEWDDDSTTYAATVTLWASNKQDPSEADDTDWVQMTANNNFDGLPAGNPTGGDGKDLVDLGISGALWYRWKFARTAGSATLQAYTSRKDRR